uniref:Uncharacterized protein n=1 Tax=Guillardia theta TaxID=55529 RepID=A0A7S4U9E3_GUITH
MAASRSHEMETLRSGNAANGGQQTGDDEAVARALQEEYDRENRELAQARMHAPLPDYRRAGYQDPSYSSHDPPTIVHVACSTCRDINAIPFSPAPIDFRCCRCGECAWRVSAAGADGQDPQAFSIATILPALIAPTTITSGRHPCCALSAERVCWG